MKTQFDTLSLFIRPHLQSCNRQVWKTFYFINCIQSLKKAGVPPFWLWMAYTPRSCQTSWTKIKVPHLGIWWLEWRERSLPDNLMDQYFLLAMRLEGYLVYKQAAWKTSLSSGRGEGSVDSGSVISDGRYPSSCWTSINPNLGLSPEERKKIGMVFL